MPLNSRILCVFFFFFFQAEDGIRDWSVTGVQTCALPISFRLETGRSIGNDWVVRHGNRFFQVKRQSRYAPTKSQVVVCEWEDGKLEIRSGGRRLNHEEIAARPAIQPRPVKPRQSRRLPAPPPAGHPWRTGYRQMQARSGTAK